MSSIAEAEQSIMQGTITPDKALSLASSMPEVAKAAEELGLTFTDMNADEILDDVETLQTVLANAKFDRLERLLSDKNVGRAEKLSAIANTDLSGNTR
jgi:copper homeostasis protein CutC